MGGRAYREIEVIEPELHAPWSWQGYEDFSRLEADPSWAPDSRLLAREAGPEPEPEPDDPFANKRWALDHCRAQLNEVDRVLWVALDRGATQVGLAARFGINQPSISTRRKVARRWLGRVVPVWAEAGRAALEPPTPRECPRRSRQVWLESWSMVVQKHRPQVTAARMLGQTQGHVRWACWRVSNWILETQPESPYAPLCRAWVASPQEWARPIFRRAWMRSGIEVEDCPAEWRVASR